MYRLFSKSGRLRYRTTSPLQAQSSQTRGYFEKSGLHATQKPHNLDIQTKALRLARKERQENDDPPQDRGQRKDPGKEFREAPRPIIGMQDERGASMHYFILIFFVGYVSDQ
ncbi:hypothetical protein RUND412_001007 [Rhizina undulata]